MPFGDVDTASAYLMRRLEMARNATQLPFSAQFDLARTPLSDDELEDTIDLFRDAPRERMGWGLADQFGELMSRAPNSVQVEDIKALQTNLLAQGYLPPEYTPSGTWGASDYAAFRRFDRDNREEQMAGHHWYSAPMESGMRAITNTLPSRVFQGIVGAAKGTVFQAPETATRVGLAGGALGGALIGTAIAPGVGTLVGGGIGAAVGFFSDLFTEQEGEEGQSVPQSILDALSPFEEYSQGGPKAFWEDLGFVLTAASLAAGGAGIVRGVGAATDALAAARLSPELGTGRVFAAGAGGAAETTVQAAQPASFLRAALQPTAAAGKQELGIMGTILRAAETKALGGTPGALTATMERFSPISFVNRIGPQVALKTFTGLSQAQMGARLFGGIGMGSSSKFVEARTAMEATLGRDLTEDELAEISKKTASSTIEQEISDAPMLKSGINIPLLGDAVDLASFALYPEKLLPFSGTRIAAGTTSLLGDTALAPFVHAVQHGTDLSVGEARAKVKDLLSPVDNAWMRADYGINFEARQAVAKRFPGSSEEAFMNRALPAARADVIRTIGKEMDAAGKSETLERVMAYSLIDPEMFTAELIRQGSTNSGLDRLKNWKAANEVARRTEREVGENMRYLRDSEGNVTHAEAWIAGEDISVPYMGGEFTRPTREKVKVGGVKRSGSSLDTLSIETRITQLEDLAKRRESYAARGAQDPMASIAARNEALQARAEIKNLKVTLEDLKRQGKKKIVPDKFKVVPATKDFVTKQDFLDARKQFSDLRAAVLNAQGDGERIIARQNLTNFVDDLNAKGMLSEKAAKSAKVERPSEKAAEELLNMSHGAAAEVKLPERLQRQFDELGYKPVETGDDVLMPDQLSQMVEVTGIGDYTRRAAVWDSLGLNLRKAPDKSIFQIRHQSELAEMRQVFEEHGIKLSAEQGMKRLHEQLEGMNHDGAVLASIVKPKEGKARLYKVDTRDLSPEHILQAFGDVPGFNDQTARDVFGALRRGAAYGGELKLLHPIDSARSIGRAMRINGLPGFSDVVRTWHAEDPLRMSRSAWRQEKFTYRPPSSPEASLNLARSAQRARVETGLKDIAANTAVSEGQRNIGMAMLDSLAIGQVKSGRFKTVDEFFSHLDVGYAERYIQNNAEALYKIGPGSKNHEQLKELAQVYEDADQWYQKSAETLQEIFGGKAKVELLDGTQIDAPDLMAQLIAATSPLTAPDENWEEALRVFNRYLDGDGLHTQNILPSKAGMVDDILNGKTIDKWEQPFRTTKSGAPASSRSRMKVYNFYKNLSGNFDNVTVDTWMGRLFDTGGPVSAKDYDFIEAAVRDVAKDLGIAPASVQARLWDAVKDEAAAEYISKALELEKAGKASGKYRNLAKQVRDARSYADLTQEPKIRAELDPLLDRLNSSALLQKVEDRVLGATQFGPDYDTVMRLFSNADFSTLVHEDAHLLRRLLPDQDVKMLEQAYGVVSAPQYQSAGRVVSGSESLAIAKRGQALLERVRSGERKKLVNLTQRRIDEVFDSVNGDEWGGMTMDLRNGGKIDPDTGFAGGMVPNADTVTISLEDAADKAKFTNALQQARKKFRSDLSREDVGLGVFRDPEKGTVTFEPSLYTRDRADAEALVTHLGAEGGAFNFGTKTLDEQDNVFPAALEERLSGGWTRDAEERFALDAEKAMSWLLQKKRPNVDGIGDRQVEMLKDTIGALWAHTRGVARERNSVPRSVRRMLDEHFAVATNLAPIRASKKAFETAASKQVVGGAAAGAALGAYEGREDGIFDKDMAKGALLGATGGLVARKAIKQSYGYLPDYLTRVNTALRYTLSFTFDAGRYTEQNSIAMMKYGLPPMLSPTKYIKGREWKSPFRNGTVRGEEAWGDAVKFWDEMNGTSYFQSIDDLDRRMYQAGLLGFSPRNWEAAQAWQLYQRGMGKDEISEAIAQIGRYGTGRSAAEKSANFVVFPFSFSKKYLQTIGDFIMQTPGRNLLLHEGSRRYYESEADEKVNDFLDRHLPILKELATVNNLAFGISPGRFFLQGISDHRTNVGKASQLLASFFVPSGAATPLAEAFGNAGDFAVHAFHPVVITGESINRAGGIDGFQDIFRRYIPFIRELDQYFTGENAAIPRQIKALMEGADPYYQFSRYQDGLREIKQSYTPMAAALGYASVDGLLSSDAGASLAPVIDAQEQALRMENPSGFSMAQEFTNQDGIDEAALADLSNKADRSQAEDAILQLREDIERYKSLGSLLGLDPSVMAAMAASNIRGKAEGLVGDDRFAELWDRFFLRDYGPIRRVA